MGRPSVQYNNFLRPQSPIVERQDFVELGVFELNGAFYSWEMMEISRKLYGCLAKKTSPGINCRLVVLKNRMVDR
jgi:hypothetical protein